MNEQKKRFYLGSKNQKVFVRCRRTYIPIKINMQLLKNKGKHCLKKKKEYGGNLKGVRTEMRGAKGPQLKGPCILISIYVNFKFNKHNIFLY